MNTEATLDFCKMVIEYMNMELESGDIDEGVNPLNGMAINYGEIDSWVKEYPNLCEDFMVGESKLSEVADELTYAMYKFASMTNILK